MAEVVAGRWPVRGRFPCRRYCRFLPEFLPEILPEGSSRLKPATEGGLPATARFGRTPIPGNHLTPNWWTGSRRGGVHVGGGKVAGRWPELLAIFCRNRCRCASCGLVRP